MSVGGALASRFPHRELQKGGAHLLKVVPELHDHANLTDCPTRLAGFFFTSVWSFLGNILNRGGLSWWTVPSLLRLARWTWPSGTFLVTDMVILPGSENDIDTTSERSSTSANTASPAVRGDAGNGAGAAGDTRPCVACISAAGEVRVVRLGPTGVDQLYSARGIAGRGMLTVASALRHQFFLVTK